MAKVTARVILTTPSGDFVTLVPGDTVPEWATVTNPAALEPVAKILPAPAPKRRPARKAPADS